MQMHKKLLSQRGCTTLRVVENFLKSIMVTGGHCLSNAVHGRNINLGACVCVSATLSDNSPTGKTPQRIFTVDSLKDADLRKDVPFGSLDDE